LPQGFADFAIFTSMKHLLMLCVSVTLCCCKANHLVSGRLKNLTGLDGCSWVIELDAADKNGNKNLEPLNLDQFKITLTEGQKVKLRYKEVNAMSICMAGKPVQIEVISEK